MGAPKGNQFWKARTKVGREKLFESPERLKEAAEEYFEWVDANPLYESKAFAYQGTVVVEELPKMRAMTISGLCIFLCIHHDTWYEYRKRKDFTEVCTQIEQIIREQKFTGAAADLLNPSIIARDLGLADKKDLTSSDGSMSPKSLSDFYDEVGGDK